MFWHKKKVPILLAGLAIVASLHVAVASNQKSERAHRPDVVTDWRSPYRGPVGARLKTTTIPEPRSGGAAMTSASTIGAPSTLVLYDTSGEYGWVGELYAILTANLASHFGTWTAEPISRYTARQLESFTATVYIGSTYDEAIPT